MSIATDDRRHPGGIVCAVYIGYIYDAGNDCLRLVTGVEFASEGLIGLTIVADNVDAAWSADERTVRHADNAVQLPPADQKPLVRRLGQEFR